MPGAPLDGVGKSQSVLDISSARSHLWPRSVSSALLSTQALKLLSFHTGAPPRWRSQLEAALDPFAIRHGPALGRKQLMLCRSPLCCSRDRDWCRRAETAEELMAPLCQGSCAAVLAVAVDAAVSRAGERQVGVVTSSLGCSHRMDALWPLSCVGTLVSATQLFQTTEVPRGCSWALPDPRLGLLLRALQGLRSHMILSRDLGRP
ncbi:hypothetical protein NDU88_001484 [Pleurodeles waltl]|uniref:Uncharacterized protein n=1 Tax=Pleurodeles waltl TaxID=8319 RepID=A0AAV7KT19_PLEWA|nr:hypothetical protein NDU88_001484 [Pleurodeles waltl]